MRSLLIAAVAALALGGPAMAADAYTKELPSITQPFPSVNLSGLYASIAAGAAFTNAQASGGGSQIDLGLEGGRVSGRLGFDWTPFGGSFFAGPYVEGAWGNVSGKLSFGFGGLEAKSDWTYGAGVRAGWAPFKAATVYGLIGYQGGFEGLAGNYERVNGVKLGAGTEVYITKSIFVGAEADWVLYGDYSPIKGVTVSSDTAEIWARIGVKY
jgi:opacity protein-like surface antigen